MSGVEGELVGRSREFTRLREPLQRAEDGDAQFASVAGEAGIGKSRLLAELARHASAASAPSLG